MRILILHSTYLSGPVSGENRVVTDESRLLREAGHEVGVLAPTPDVSGPLGAVRAGMSAIWSLRAAREVGETVRRRKIEIVHVHNLFPGLSPAVLRSARSAGASVIVTLHNFRLMCLPANLLRDGKICEACVGHLPWRGIVHRCYRDSALGSAALATSLVAHRGIGTFDGVERFLAVSGFVRDKYIEAGMRSEQVEVKPNFTWPLGHRDGPGDYFLYLGRLAPEKGVDTLIDAWRSHAPKHPLVVIGDGPDADILRRDAPAGVEFRGRVSTDEAGRALAHARALMVPSRWYEAAPRSIIEAYAAGVPVVASHIGALPEAVIDGISGLLVATDDARAWAEAASSLDDDTSVRLSAGALRLWEERSSPERGLARLETAYRETLRAANV
jgi:glycosyltransferase involved in cell wall biosynthesis